MSLSSLELALRDIHLRQCEFTRGYWIGRIRGQLDAGMSNVIYRLPQAYLDDVREVLKGYPPNLALEELSEEKLSNNVTMATVTIRPARVEVRPKAVLGNWTP